MKEKQTIGFIKKERTFLNFRGFFSIYSGLYLIKNLIVNLESQLLNH
jgi:hypothetical protein